MLNRVPDPEHYPHLRLALERRWQQRPNWWRLPGWPWIVAGLLALALFGLLVLPYLLPLGGPGVRAPADLADPDGAFIDVDGETLYYTHLPGDEGPVVLVHGFGGSTVTWTDTMRALADAGYEVYALDLAGFGLSEKGWSLDYSAAAQAARVTGLMNALGIERTVLVGHSMGGQVAATVALADPERVSALVLVAPALATSEHLAAPGVLLDLPVARRWARIALRQAAPRVFDDLLLDAAYDDAAISPDLRDAYRRVLSTPDWDQGLLGIVRDAGDALPGSLGEITVPVLLVWGAQDTWVDPGQGDGIAQQAPDVTRVTLDGVGHLPMHEDPAAFNAVLLDFLAGI